MHDRVWQPGVDLGNCWAFPGDRGEITVKLAQRIVPQAVSVDHVSKRIAIDITSAPKRFKVWVRLRATYCSTQEAITQVRLLPISHVLRATGPARGRHGDTPQNKSGQLHV